MRKRDLVQVAGKGVRKSTSDRILNLDNVTLSNPDSLVVPSG